MLDDKQVDQLIAQRRQAKVVRWLAIGGLMACSVLLKLTPYLLERFGRELDVTEATSYLWNFSPMLPLMLVLGSSCRVSTATILALSTWLLGDLGIWAITERFDWAFYSGSALVYLCVFLVVITGYMGNHLARPATLGSRIQTNLISGFLGAILFFAVSNFFVWMNGSNISYPLTLGGLIECYTMAIPFHRNDFWSMLIFVPLFTTILSLQTVSQKSESYDALAEKI